MKTKNTKKKGATQKEEQVRPKKQSKKSSDVQIRDGEKRLYLRNETDEQDSDGSANAFEGK